MNAKEIIESVLAVLNITPTRLAEEMGASPSRINDILNGKTVKVTPRTAKDIIQVFPGLSFEYLTAGTGSMFTDGEHHEPLQDRMTPSQVINAILVTYHINAKQLGDAAGISRGNISSIITGHGNIKNISPTNAQRIKAVYPDLRLEWIKTGKGAMMEDGKLAPMIVTQTKKVTTTDDVIIRLQSRITELEARQQEMERKYNKAICQILSRLDDAPRSNYMVAEDEV